MSYLTLKDNLLRKLDSYSLSETPSHSEMKAFLACTDLEYEVTWQLLQKADFVKVTTTTIVILIKGREFISYTSFQNEYDKSFAKELYDTAVQNDYKTTRRIANWAIAIAAISALIELIKLLSPCLRHQ